MVAPLLLLMVALPAQALELRTAAQDSAPKYLRQADGSMGGICIEIMQALEQADPDLRFTGTDNFMPFKRLQRQLANGEIDVFFGFKRTGSRLAKYRFLDNPLYQVNYVLAARRDDPLSIQSFDDLIDAVDDARVATVGGSAASKFLREQGSGLRINDSLTSPTQLMNILQVGRIRFAFYHDLGLEHVIDAEGFESSLKILPVSFSRYNHYVAFSKDTADSTIARVEKALEKIREDGTLARIQRKYHLRSD